MKKTTLLIAALILSTATAGRVQQDIQLNVENACVFSGGPSDGRDINTSPQVNQPGITVTYNAAESTPVQFTAYTVQCTSGTVFNTTDMSGSLTFSGGGTSFTVPLIETLTPALGLDLNSPDTYTMTGELTIPAGMWGLPAGTYTAIASYDVTY